MYPLIRIEVAPPDTPEFPGFDFNSPIIAMVQLGITMLLPLLVGLISTHFTHPGWKVAALGFLSLLGALGTGWLDATASGLEYDWLNNIANGVISWLFSIAAYYGIWKPPGITDRLQETNFHLLPSTRTGGDAA